MSKVQIESQVTYKGKSETTSKVGHINYTRQM